MPGCSPAVVLVRRRPRLQPGGSNASLAFRKRSPYRSFWHPVGQCTKQPPSRPQADPAWWLYILNPASRGPRRSGPTCKQTLAILRDPKR